MKFRTKQFFQNTMAAAALLTVGSVATIQLQRVETMWGDYRADVVEKRNHLSEFHAQMGYGGAIHLFKNYVLRGKEKYQTRFIERQEAVANSIAVYRSLGSVGEEELVALEQIQEMMDLYGGAIQTASVLWAEGKSIKEIDGAIKIDDAPFIAALDTLNEQLNASVESQSSQLSTQIASSIAMIVGILGASIIAVVATGIFISRSLSRPIANLIARLRDIAEGEGDLTKRVDENRKDELGELGKWFNKFLDDIHSIISDVSGTSQEVASAATQIAASSEELSAGMTQQQEQTSQAAVAIKQMSSSITEVANKAGAASEMSGTAGTQATAGGEVVEQTIKGMNSINVEVNQSATAVGELGKRGEQIGEIISVINDIADQTNLLALNAAIEAARAGEHGRGFAVVADEVRKLAERTTTATEEVAGSINAIQNETTIAVKRMEQGKARVTEGVTLAKNAGESLRQIVAGSSQVSEMIQSIATEAGEQSAAANQVSRSIESISAISNESAEGVRQTARAANQLSTKAEQLRGMISKFKTNSDGDDSCDTL